VGALDRFATLATIAVGKGAMLEDFKTLRCAATSSISPSA
jgi:hypothetical protein